MSLPARHQGHLKALQEGDESITREMEACNLDREVLPEPPPSSEQPLEDTPSLKARYAAEPHQPGIEPGIFKVPVELILKVLELTDLKSAFNFTRTNKAFRPIWDGNREHIMMSILRTELSPFDDLLQVVVSKPDDIKIPLGPCLHRRVYHMNKLCCEGEVPRSGEEAHAILPPVVLTEEHFDRLLHLFGVVKRWEEHFPRYRFGSVSDCRGLLPDESRRLRAAMYHWMSYGYFFHGELPRPNQFVPQKYSTDIRCKRLRLLSDNELHELNDLWQTVQKMVQCNICPSTEMVLKRMDGTISKEEAERIGFGSSKKGLARATFSWNDSTFVDFDSNVNSAIVDTFLKLSPAEILQFTNHRSAYSRDRLIREARLANPDILSDRQSLGHALSAVMEERQDERLSPETLDRPARSLEEVKTSSSGGILEFESWDAELRENWDGSGQRALSWDVNERPQLRIRVVMNEGRLEP
ncbi:hypothetical protein VMCG_09553 [Cytospora schulzeri]|uniref:F-box domain-containing protein n=1 Tax=Cytospora schulzeri TaxID=448051 RepID=A0A423VM74_9PEZI|nr:hypothetical protein VMCG_09553 [Valsa malicola]